MRLKTRSSCSWRLIESMTGLRSEAVDGGIDRAQGYPHPIPMGTLAGGRDGTQPPGEGVSRTNVVRGPAYRPPHEADRPRGDPAMLRRPTITTARARLVAGRGDAAANRCYRPLVAGLAMLVRAPGAAAWTVDIDCDRVLRPRVPRSGGGNGPVGAVARRLGVVLAGPFDATPRLAGSPPGPPRIAPCRRLCLDFYGWALLYQPPGMRGRAIVDADDRFAELPAVFELPLELLDRAEFLEARGFRTRSLVIPTLPDDFARGLDGRLRNRFFPGAAYRPPCGLERLL